MPNYRPRWNMVALLATGALAGIVATLLMVLLMVAGRYWLGISPPPEALPDRFAPHIPIKQFFELFDRFGGYNGLKKFGIKSGLGGLGAAGILVGIAYAAVVEWKDRHSSRRGRIFIVAAAAVMWVGSVALYWPVLATNFRGLPPSRARFATAGGLLIYYVAFAVVLVLSYRFLTRPRIASTEAVPVAPPVPESEPIGRRSFVAAGAAVALAVPSYLLMKRLYDQAAFAYDGRPYSGPGIKPIAPNDSFYTVTKNVVDPDVSTSVWRLEIGGMVNHPRGYDLDELKALSPVKQETTLMCISNKTGAGLFSNALWTGVPMAELLNAAGVQKGAVEVFLRAADGYTDTFAIEKALDPTTMVVYLMNGDPLPRRHGFPVRVIAPGLFGEKNVKWVTAIEVIDHDGKGFYETQGWGPHFEVPTRSDIFAPSWRRGGSGDNFTDPIKVGQSVRVRGRAFAGARGVSKVEFSADGGKTWGPVEIDYEGTQLTWMFWSVNWRPSKPGEYTLLSRATDGDGTPQSDVTRGIAPQGATGYHRVKATVTA